MTKTSKWVGWVVALALSALLAYGLSTRGVLVDVVMVSQGPMVQSVVTSGRIATAARTDVASQSTALITHIDVREGDLVTSGQVLVRLRDDEAQAALQQCEATVAEAHTGNGGGSVSGRPARTPCRTVGSCAGHPDLGAAAHCQHC